MVILPALLLAVTGSAPVAPPPSAAPAPAEVIINVHAPKAHASMAPTAAAPVVAEATPEVKDPFAGVVARVVITPAPTVLHDPFAATNIRARYRNTAPSNATLRDPFSK